MIFVLSGPGGAGKGTLVERLVASDERLWLSRSWTTRPRRPGEPEDAYVFVDRERFLAKAKAGGFLEWATVLDHYYGTPTPEPPAGCDVVLEIDVQGAAQVVERCKDVVCILVLPPSPEEQARRLRARGDDEAHVRRRLELAGREVEAGERLADYVVVNDDVDRALAELRAIVARARAGA
ncbi:MAG TPA: guanylate kinase [Acidimicrobiales bacterium]|nr:guanylate kinase [Acidimicrobiales bacterium]